MARLALGGGPLLSVALFSAIAIWSPPSLADPESEVVESARSEFAEGTGHFQAKRWQDALRAFEHSHTLVASPNTELMIARCLRELGRRADSAMHYENASVEANRRAAHGEAKYTHTAEAATAEGSAVRAQIGTLRIHVERPTGVTVTIDKKSVVLSKEGDAFVLRDPGTVSVSVSEASGAEQRQTVSVQAGATVEMDFAPQATPPKPEIKPDRPLVPPPKPPGDRQTEGASWAWPAALGAGALTAAGLGVFIGFGISSQSTYDDLVTRCGQPPRCGPADRADADSGQSAQTVANIGLGVAATAAVATIVFVIVAMTSHDRPVARLFDATRPGPL